MKIDFPSFEIKEKEETKRFYGEIFDKKIYQMDTCIDIGANVGLFTFFIAHLFKNIYSIEGLPSNFETLKENIADNALTHVKCFNYAMGGKNEMRKFSLHKQDGGNAIQENLSDQYTMVQGKTLAAFMKEQNIDKVDLLKIDIEGGEAEIFLSNDFKEVASKISIIIGEHSNDDMINRLKNLGFQIKIHPSIYPSFFSARR